MADIAAHEKTPLAKVLFRREIFFFLIILVCSLVLFIVLLRLFFQTMWDQATESVRVEIEKEADTIARLLVFEFSHLTELETQAIPDNATDERVKRLLWEKVTFNETIRGIELIHRRSDPQGRHLTYSFFPLSQRESDSEQGPQQSLKSFSGPEGDLIRIINREQRVDKSILDSINQGRKLESEMLLRYFPLYIPLPDQGALYWGVTKVGINADAMRRFQVLMENERAGLRRTLALIMGGLTAFALGLGLLGFRWISQKTAAPLTDYGMLDESLASGVGVDIESLLARLGQQESQGILEFEQLQNFSLRLGGTIKSLAERLIDAEPEACLGRLAARLAQAGGEGRLPDTGFNQWAGLLLPLPPGWHDVDLNPYLEQISSLLKVLLPAGTPLIEDRQPISPVYGSEARLVQALLGLMDFALQAMPPGGQLQWRVFPRQAGGLDLEMSFSGRSHRQEDISGFMQPFKVESQTFPPLGPFLAAAIARQHGGSLSMQPNPGGGLRLHLEIPDGKVTSTGGGTDEDSGVA